MKKIIIAACLAIVALLGFAGTAGAVTPVTYTHTVTISGTSTTQPTNGVLFIHSDVAGLDKTDYVTYYLHDGYLKKIDLGAHVSGGVLLKQEDFENNCGSSGNAGAVNPVGGTGIICTPVLHKGPTTYPVTGDLAGRYCRVPPPGHKLPCPIVITRTEVPTGSGQYLTAGGKDHGAFVKIVYQAITGKHLVLLFPSSRPLLITRIVLSPRHGGPFVANVVLH